MSINFDHSRESDIILSTNELANCSVLNFPSANEVLEIMVSGRAQINHISGLSCLLSECNQTIFSLNQVNNCCSYSYSNSSNSISEVCNSIIFGSSGKAKANYFNGYGLPINSQFIHSKESLFVGGSQNTTLLSISDKINNCNPTNYVLISGNLDCQTLLMADFDIIGKGTSLNNSGYAALKIKAAIYRELENSCVSILNSCCLVAGNLNENFATGISTNSSGWAICVDNANYMSWLTRASILEICASGNVANLIHGKYWQYCFTSNWFDLSGWWSDEFITQANSYPLSSEDVVMSGCSGAYVNLNCNLWIQPNSIDVNLITDEKGICFYSLTGYHLSPDLVNGNISLYGNVIYG